MGSEGGSNGDALRCVCVCVCSVGAGLTEALGEGPGFHSWFVTIWLLQAAAGLPPPALPQCPMGFYREVTTAAKHTLSPNAYSTRPRALTARTQRNNIKTLWSGGAPDSTRQRKGGWRDGFPLCVAMATTLDGERLVSCTAVELGGIHFISFKYFSVNVSLITCQYSALPVSISRSISRTRQLKGGIFKNGEKNIDCYFFVLLFRNG